MANENRRMRTGGDPISLRNVHVTTCYAVFGGTWCDHEERGSGALRFVKIVAHLFFAERVRLPTVLSP
jgi:hypothetical protein